MPQNQPRRSEMWWHGHNDALAGDPPNESYYHYYYDYKLAYDHVRREQRRSRRQRLAATMGRRLLLAGPVALLLGYLAYGAWNTAQPETAEQQSVAAVATRTPRPTPRPTLPPATSTPEPALRPDSYAVIDGTQGAALRARSQPGLSGATVTRYREGQTVHVLEGPQVVDNLEWWRVEADGQGGWAAGSYLKPIEHPSEIATPAP